MSKYRPGTPLVGTPDDRRVRLTAAQKQEVRERYKGGAGIRELARMYDVSRRLVQFVLFPERLEAALLAREIHGGSKSYYKRRRHTEAMRRHRAHKKEVKENRAS